MFKGDSTLIINKQIQRHTLIVGSDLFTLQFPSPSNAMYGRKVHCQTSRLFK
jgi:hypothetical protein